MPKVQRRDFSDSGLIILNSIVDLQVIQGFFRSTTGCIQNGELYNKIDHVLMDGWHFSDVI